MSLESKAIDLIKLEVMPNVREGTKLDQAMKLAIASLERQDEVITYRDYFSIVEKTREARREGDVTDINEAVDYLNNHYQVERFNEINPDASKHNRVMDLSINALKKQIPMRPRYHSEDYGYYVCDSCGEVITYAKKYPSHMYCLSCGQRLLWEDR